LICVRNFSGEVTLLDTASGLLQCVSYVP
jgi:hypothetical protein